MNRYRPSSNVVSGQAAAGQAERPGWMRFARYWWVPVLVVALGAAAGLAFCRKVQPMTGEALRPGYGVSLGWTLLAVFALLLFGLPFAAQGREGLVAVAGAQLCFFMAVEHLSVAVALLLDPQLMLIDEPSIGLSPVLVQQIFAILQDLRAQGVSILMVEQNAKRALEISDFGVVLELGCTRMQGDARQLLADPRVGQLFLGGATL